MPFCMSNHTQAVTVMIGDNIYVGGGFTDSTKNRGTVMVYSILDTGSWRTLPPYETQWFGMAAVNSQLVLVGGSITSNDEVTGVLIISGRSQMSSAINGNMWYLSGAVFSPGFCSRGVHFGMH